MKHLGSKELVTQRLILRKIIKDDAKEIFEGFINQENFLYYANKEKRTLEEEIESLVGIEDKYSNLSYYNWVITLKENKNIIGSINAYFIDEEEKVVINYAIDDRYKNNNYMSESLIEVLRFLKEEVKIENIECGCVTKNIASKRVMEKANMKYVGILEKEVLLKDGYHDMHLFRY